MEEIKVGEYVRTKDGIIAKVTYVDAMMVDCDRDVFDLDNLAMMEIPVEFIEEYIVKHSKKIIDLIEEGDYVNGKLIHKVDIRENSAYIYYGNGKTFCDYQIKDIVTKEQYNQMKYIVGDE